MISRLFLLPVTLGSTACLFLVSVEMIDQGRPSFWERQIFFVSIVTSTIHRASVPKAAVTRAVSHLFASLCSSCWLQDASSVHCFPEQVKFVCLLPLVVLFFFSTWLNFRKVLLLNLLLNLHSHILPLLTSKGYNCPCVCLGLLNRLVRI